jgi:hypothetical protein
MMIGIAARAENMKSPNGRSARRRIGVAPMSKEGITARRGSGDQMAGIPRRTEAVPAASIKMPQAKNSMFMNHLLALPKRSRVSPPDDLWRLSSSTQTKTVGVPGAG